MSARVIPMPQRAEAPALPDFAQFDTQALAARVTECVEAYQRASWTQISRPIQLAKLAEAKRILERIADLESGRIAMPVFGD